MSGEKPERRSTKLSNWMIAVLLAAVALTAYGLIAVRIHQHGIGG
jgi:type VI protein secretion system component VasF